MNREPDIGKCLTRKLWEEYRTQEKVDTAVHDDIAYHVLRRLDDRPGMRTLDSIDVAIGTRISVSLNHRWR